MNRSLKTPVLGMLGLAASAACTAQTLPDAMRGCMQVADSLQRLHCFEQLTRTIGVKRPGPAVAPQPAPAAQQGTPGNTPTQRPAERYEQPAVPARQPVQSWNPQAAIASGLMPGKTKVGKWEVTVSGNPVSGAHDVRLRLKSVAGRNQYAAPIGLVVECKNGQGTARMIWDEYLVRDVPIAVNLDGQHSNAATDGWQFSKDYQQWTMTGDIRPMLAALQAHKQMSIDVKSYETVNDDDGSDGSIHAVWDLAGTEFALGPFYTLCGH